MFDRCFAEGNIRQAVGIALESVRLDKLEECIKAGTDKAATLAYCLEACQTLVQSRSFRDQVLKVLVLRVEVVFVMLVEVSEVEVTVLVYRARQW